jgi:hypothetical protein
VLLDADILRRSAAVAGTVIAEDTPNAACRYRSNFTYWNEIPSHTDCQASLNRSPYVEVLSILLWAGVAKPMVRLLAQR